MPTPDSVPAEGAVFTHARALHYPQFGGAKSDCPGELAYMRRVFHSDVSWDKYLCRRCLRVIYMVGGSRHWWNYDREPYPEEVVEVAQAMTGQKQEIADATA